MKFKSELIILYFLFFSFIGVVLLLVAYDFMETKDALSILLEGFTFISILFFLILTIKMKAHIILILGCFFISTSSFFNVLEEVGNVELSEFVDTVLENVLFTLGVLLSSIGVLFLLNKRNEMDEKLKHQATHDSLTGLSNWYMVNEHLQNAIIQSKKKNHPIALMFLDLDHFKFVNDSKGHKAGDGVLQQVAKRLSSQIPEGQLVGRKGGDEFLVILENADRAIALDVASRLLESIEEPFYINNDEFFISTSIGISLFPQDGNQHDVLINKADKAMYLAKKSGKNTIQFFVTESEDALSRKLIIETDLRKAIINEELALYYQPKIELKTGMLLGVEALLRWNHPVLGMISPMEFIPIAESSGMIIPIGEWVVETACKQNRKWQDQGYPPFSIAVNVSALQFHDRKLVDMIQWTLKKHQIAPELLEIEITESVMQDVKESFQIINELKQLGIRVAIDDFGTGYSSLNLLHKLTVDYVKIDKSFIKEIFTNKASASLVKTMIEMGSIMGFRLIAEGIEEEKQAVFLTDNGCDIGQGYFYSPPLPERELESVLEKHLVSYQQKQ